MLADDPKEYREHVNWLRPASLAGWEYLIADWTRHLWSVYHETYALCASHHYGQTWCYRGRNNTMLAPGLMLIEPGETHRTLSIPSPVSFKVAIIPPEEVAEAADELGLRTNSYPHLRTALTNDAKLNNAVLRLGEIAETGNASLLEMESRQTEIIRMLIGYTEHKPSSATDGLEARAVQRAIKYLRAKLCAQVTLGELVATSGLGRFRLVRAFTRSTGLPPHAYHLQLRIAEARRLLQQGKAGAEIATILGFADQPHFIRHFRKILCVSPSAYIKGSNRFRFACSPQEASNRHSETFSKQRNAKRPAIGKSKQPGGESKEVLGPRANDASKFRNPTSCAASQLQGKWTVAILCVLKAGPVRLDELSRLLPEASKKMLMTELKQLVLSGIVVRHDLTGNNAVRHVEYCLGKSIEAATAQLLQQLEEWNRVTQAVVNNSKSEHIR